MFRGGRLRNDEADGFKELERLDSHCWLQRDYRPRNKNDPWKLRQFSFTAIVSPNSLMSLKIMLP
jgi:hypothetical protein